MKLRLIINTVTTTLLIIILGGRIISAQDCKANIEIISNSETAFIYIDSVLVGKGNVRLELAKGEHFLRMDVSSLNWDRPEIRDTIKISDCSKYYTFNYKFKKESSIQISKPDFDFGKLKNDESFFTSTSFKILLGGAALFGGIAAYYKIKADKKYDDYLITKNQSTLDEVNRLDLYSGISFGFLQINFGYLIYKFLTD